nr:hypothetical protein [Tanacetum cinerariifolium]
MKRKKKEPVKRQVKEQVSKILPRIEQSMNAQLEAKVLTRLSHSSRTSYAVAADLSEMELKKILIEKMKGNKFIQHSDEQRNLYKALVNAYEADKIILDSYREIIILKRRRDDDDDQDEGPFVGSDRGSKRRRKGVGKRVWFCRGAVRTTSQIEEPSHPVFEIGAEDQPIFQSSQHPEWFSQPKKPPTPDYDWNKTLPSVQGSTQTWISELTKQAYSRSSFNKLLDTPLDFSKFIMNRLRVDTLFFIISSIAVQIPGSGISNLLAVGTTFTGIGNFTTSGNSLLLDEALVPSAQSLQSLDETELIGITSGMMYCSLQSRWYRDTRLLNNTVRYYVLSLPLKTSGTQRLIRSTMLVLLDSVVVLVSAHGLSSFHQYEVGGEEDEALLLQHQQLQLWLLQGYLLLLKGRDESEGEKTDEGDDDDDAQEEAEKVNDDDDNEEEVPKI